MIRKLITAVLLLLIFEMVGCSAGTLIAPDNEIKLNLNMDNYSYTIEADFVAKKDDFYYFFRNAYKTDVNMQQTCLMYRFSLDGTNQLVAEIDDLYIRGVTVLEDGFILEQGTTVTTINKSDACEVWKVGFDGEVQWKKAFDVPIIKVLHTENLLAIVRYSGNSVGSESDTLFLDTDGDTLAEVENGQRLTFLFKKSGQEALYGVVETFNQKQKTLSLVDITTDYQFNHLIDLPCALSEYAIKGYSYNSGEIAFLTNEAMVTIENKQVVDYTRFADSYLEQYDTGLVCEHSPDATGFLIPFGKWREGKTYINLWVMVDEALQVLTQEIKITDGNTILFSDIDEFGNILIISREDKNKLNISSFLMPAD